MLWSQLYGEADADQDVSPDTQDPEAVGRLMMISCNKCLIRIL